MDIFVDIGLIIIVATLGGFIAKALKQPLISSYIIMGVVIGPILGLVKDMAVVDVLSEIGIAFLLFIVGIELDLKRLKDVGSIASAGALLQMALSFLAGFATFMFLGLGNMTAVYAGIVVMFSSTMVVIKLLSDKSQLDTIHGRIVIGGLLMQDVVAVMLLSILNHAGSFSLMTLLISLFQGSLVFLVALFFSKFLFPQLFKFAAKSQELFFLLSLTVCFLFSLIFVKIGFSIAIGAFVGGLMLGNLPYNLEIVGKVKSLRDFFATVFFVSMGIKLTFSALTDFTVPFIALVILSSIFAPFLTFITTMMFGYSRRVAFLTAISLSQVSEFALIAIAQGVKIGHIGDSFLSLTILVTLVTIMATSYYMKFEDSLYRFLLPVLKKFDKFVKKKKQFHHRDLRTEHDTILVGYDRIGYSVYKTLKKQKREIVIVDFNPEIITNLMKKSVPCIYGDISDDEVLYGLELNKVKLLISTIPNTRDTLLLIEKVRRMNQHAKIIVTAYLVEDALQLYQAGADYVILPHLLGGKHASILLEDISFDVDKLIKTKLTHINELKHHKHRFSNPVLD